MPREVGAFALLELQGVTAFKTTHSVTVLITNTLGQPVLCTGADIPHDNDVGFAMGCIFISSASGIAYSNVGTALLANFDKISLT